jgi:hypothetical protein
MRFTHYARGLGAFLRRAINVPQRVVKPRRPALFDTAHAPGHRHLGPPPDEGAPRRADAPTGLHHPAWLRTGGRVDRLRHNERHGG